MNIFFVMEDGTLVTPPLGTILPGITRASLITLARDAGMTVEEQPIPSTSGRRMPPAAVSGRPSRAAPPPSSRPSAACAMPGANSHRRTGRSAP